MRTGDIITGIGDTTLDETHAYIGNQIQMDVTLGEASL
jgi:hypothetical protein